MRPAAALGTGPVISRDHKGRSCPAAAANAVGLVRKLRSSGSAIACKPQFRAVVQGRALPSQHQDSAIAHPGQAPCEPQARQAGSGAGSAATGPSPARQAPWLPDAAPI